MYFALERVQKICNDLKDLVYSKKLPINEYKMVHGNYHGMEEINNIDSSWENFQSGELWGGRDVHCWFRTEVTVPEDYSGKVIALNLKTFYEGFDAVNPQFILYIDGEHIQGLDLNHREIILSNSAEAFKTYKIDLHAYSGMDDRKVSLQGELVVIDKALRELFYNLQVPVWVCEKLDSDDKRRIDMLNLLYEAINLLDLRKPYSLEFYNSVTEANIFLRDEFYGKFCGQEDTIATCVGHTHIDVAWLWTVAQTREKVGRSFSTVLKLMEEYPEYIFMSSQPQLYKFLKEDYPQVYDKVKEKVKEGVWEPEGAMWLEADCNVTSGESLVRQILFGKKFFEEEFGVESEILWLPDVFGYNAALPQILKKSDVNYFMTTKISWNTFNKVPYDTFMWRGIDGSEVLTHFITTTGPYADKKSYFTTYNGEIHPGAVMGAWDRYQQKNLNNDVLISYGFGDGGGGATYEMLEIGRRLNKGIPGCPKVKMGTSKDYFKRLEKRVQGNKKLPKWVGELYFELHRGTYTSMARNKRDNRKSEVLYQSAEKVSAIAMSLGKTYSQDVLNKGWENILLNQFHDILPGSSIKEVYEVTNEEYKDILSKGEAVLKEATNTVVSKINLDSNSIVVFNTLGFQRDDVAEFKIPVNISEPALIDEDGNKILCQRIEDNKGIFFAKAVPANGYKTYRIIEASSLKNVETEYSGDKIEMSTEKGENQFFKIAFDEKGQIKSIIHKENNREVLKEGELGNVIQAFEDKPIYWDNWDIEYYFKEKMWIVDDVESMKVIEEGPIRATLQIVRKFVDSTIVQKIHLYKDIDKIDFNTYVDWKQHQVALKAAFPVDLNADKATYEIQYGAVERTTHNNTSWDTAQFEVCAHKWVDLSETGYGVSLLNDSKYGHDIKDGVMRLTLLKSGVMPNETTDQEEHKFTYSLYPHNGDWKDSSTVQMGYNLNVPLYTKYAEAHGGEMPKNLSFVKVDKDNVIIEVIKKAEESDDLIVRMYECHNRRSEVNMEFYDDIERACECNLIEKDEKEIAYAGNKISFTIKPFEIKTFKVKLRN